MSGKRHRPMTAVTKNSSATMMAAIERIVWPGMIAWTST